MRHRLAIYGLVLTFLTAFGVAGPIGHQASFGVSVATAQEAAPPPNPCVAPNAINVFNKADTAWRLWVAATCPVNKDQYPYVVWENWIEQAQMYPANPVAGLKVPNANATPPGSSHVLHSSPLTLIKNPNLGKIVPGLLGGADQGCNKAATPPGGQPNLVICEEVRLNGATEDYIAGTKLWKRGGEAKAAIAGADIEFSPPSVEIKADWIQLSSIGLDCSTLPAKFFLKIHVETINGNCFALAGMHLISKLQGQWIWATFEPQSPITNPNRCQVLGCTDNFGVTPAVTHGAETTLTPLLTTLMTAARLAPEFFNYRLDGVQIGFFKPKLLGNSIIEGENAGVPLTQSSCITCHSISSIKSDGTDGITLLKTNPVGAPPALPPGGWIFRDFVWSLSEACPNSPLQSCAQ